MVDFNKLRRDMAAKKSPAAQVDDTPAALMNNAQDSNLPFPDIMEEGKPNLYYDMIRANLQVPIDPALISQKPVYHGNQERFIDYVNVTDLKDILDDRAGIWTASIKHTFTTENALFTVVSVSIHAEDGIYTQDGNGAERLSGVSFGDPFSNAYAQAFRRACEGHGLGRELWRKSEQHEAEVPARQANEDPSPRTQQPSNVSHPNFSGGGQPNGGQSSGGAQVPMTQRQMSYIENVCIENNKNAEMLSLEHFKKNFADLTKNEASKLIGIIAPK